jgi:hypothetical protein
MTLTAEFSKETLLSRAVPLSSMISGAQNSYCNQPFVFCGESTASLGLDRQESSVFLDVTLFNKSTKQSLPLLRSLPHCNSDDDDYDPYDNASPYCSQELCSAWDGATEYNYAPIRPNKDALCFHSDIDAVNLDDRTSFVVQVTIHENVTLQFNHVSICGDQGGSYLDGHGYHNGSDVLSRLMALHWE